MNASLLALAFFAQDAGPQEHVYKKTPQGELKIHVHGARKGEKRPAIVFFFGGGWTQGTPEQFRRQAEHFAGRGLVAARADYRVASRHKTTPLEAVEDAKSAVRWLRRNAEDLGIDPDRVVGSGGSAGGHLAATATITDTGDAKDEDLTISSKPNLMVLFNPVFDVLSIRADRMPGPDKEGQARSISPIFFVKKETPPAVVFFGTADKLLEQGRQFLERSKELGHRVDLYTADGQPHGFFNRTPWMEATLRQADLFLVEHGYLTGESGVKAPDGAALKREGGARPEKGRWVVISESVTSKLKPAWPGLTAGIAVDPASGEVYLLVSGEGAWKSSDRGATFERVDGGKVGGRCETGAAVSVDPRGGRLAFFMLDGKSAWTGDAGKTWHPCNDKSRGFDYVAVDWTDKTPRRMFGVRHESGEIGLLSDDAGATWKELGKPWKAFGVFDFDTLVCDRGRGIERSSDGGATWEQVSDVRPTGYIMALHNGVGYWLGEKGLLASRDKGATWSPHGSPVAAWFGPYFGKDEKHLVVVGKQGFQESLDGGETWAQAAPLPSEKDFSHKWFPNFAWDPKGNVFYVSRMGKPAYKFERP